MESKRPLALLLIVFMAVAVLYSLLIPLFEGPDEDDHFRYAKFIADYRALPVQQFVAGGGEAGHQGWQPPLYYALAAAAISPVDRSDFTQHLRRNYGATFVGDPSCCGRNIYFHTDSENFPFTGTTLAVHLARLLSVLFGAIAVWATDVLVRTVAESYSPSSAPWLGLAAAAVVAFNPSFLFASALVSNDALLAALSSLILLVCVQLVYRRSAPNHRTALILGILLTLAVLTKTTALGLVPFVMLVLALAAWRDKVPGFALTGNAEILALMLAGAGWWFARNQVLYGDPLAYGLMTVTAIFPRAGPLTLPELFQISLPWLWQTFWGGPTPGDFSTVLLAILAGLTGVALAGMVIVVSRISDPAFRISLGLLAGWLAFILVAQIQFIRTTIGADQGRYLFPAIPAFALLFVIGLTEAVGRIAARWRRQASSLTPGALLFGSFALAVFVPLAYTLPAYARPPLLAAGAPIRIAKPLQMTFADQLQLLGYDLDTRSVKPGDQLQVTLYWRAVAAMPESYRVFVHLVGQDDRTAGGVDVIPARGAFPTLYWAPGDTLRDTVEIPIAPNAVPGRYALEIGLYPVGKAGDRLTVNESGEDRAVVDAIKVAPRQAAVYSPQTRLEATFAGKAALIGYDHSLDSHNLTLILYWRCLSPLGEDYKVFVHVLGDDGTIAAQADQEPQGGNAPTSLWQVGEQIRDEYVLQVPRQSKYQIEVGLYSKIGGERLPVRMGDRESDSLKLELAGAAP